MKTLIALVSLAVVAFAQSRQHPITYTVADTQSQPPITYTTGPHQAVTIKNVSSNPIIAVYVDVVGKDVETIYRHDFFTKDMQFDPKTTLPIDRDPTKDPDAQQLTVTIVWCQFADGSEWGDHEKAKIILDQRAETLNALDQLIAADDTTFTTIVDKLSEGKKSSPTTVMAETLKERILNSGVIAARSDVADRIKNVVARRAVGNF